MAAPLPLNFRWDGDAFTPVGRYARECDKTFVVGEVYRLAIHEERSTASHNHYFAQLSDAWSTLPDDQAERFPNPEALRHYALIKSGYADSRQYVAASKAEALRIAAFLRPSESYGLVTVSGCIVTVYTAQSQSLRAMGKEAFRASKDAVLAYCASLLDVEPKTLERESGRAA